MGQSKIGPGTYIVSRVFDDSDDIESVVATYIAGKVGNDEQFDDTHNDMV